MFALQKQALVAIAQGSAYLSQLQQEDGSFLSFSSANPKDFVNALQFHSIFSTALILDSLSILTQTEQLRKIKHKAASFLLRQKSIHWSFNYWTKDSEHAKSLPYPDDLDDTSCSLAALFHYDAKIIDGTVLASMINLLTNNEVQEGGPYRTWLVPETADNVWKDVDIAVNSNIAYFLSLYEIELPQLIDYIEKSIVNDKLFSPYYPSVYPIVYFLSRFYNGKHRGSLVNLLIDKRNNKHNWGNPLNTALAICALRNLQVPIRAFDKSIMYVLQNQVNGYWEPYPFYTGVNPKKDKKYYAGSGALTTAFCLEALNKYLQSIVLVDKTRQRKSDTKKILLHNQIMQNVEKRFLFLDNDTRERTSTILHKMLKGDKEQQISLLPYYFTNAIDGKKKNISEHFIMRLGTANVYGWLAYTIYDDFFDEEPNPQLLSTANISLRAVCKIYETILPKQREFIETFHQIMDNLDYVNAWEARVCKFTINNEKLSLRNFVIPDYHNYENLAKKSLGHALGPLAILFFLGFKGKSPEVKKLLLFFKHYLIARQLNDDAHDWEQDFFKGYCNSVGSLLLNKYCHQGLPNNGQAIKVKKLVNKLQTIFWDEVITEVCSLINYHAKKARHALKDNPVIVDAEVFEQMVRFYEQAAQKALDERKTALQFLQTYTS